MNPFALELLKRQEAARPTGLRSKSWDEFAAPGAPALDFVFTVCDNAAGEVCPFWPGQPMTAHWGVADPGRGRRTDLDKHATLIRETFRILERPHQIFTSLPIKKLDRLSLQNRVRDIGTAQ